MALGIGLGRAFPDLGARLDTVKLDTLRRFDDPEVAR